MLRMTSACVIAALACGCGGSPGDKEPATKPWSGPATETAAQAPAETTTEAGATTVEVAGPPRQNKFLRLAVSNGGFATGAPAAPSGLRYYTVQLRGTSRSSSDVAIETGPFVFAQNEAGCISRPVADATWLTQPFGDRMMFSGKGPTEGQLAFLVPADSQRIRVLIAPAGPGALVVPAGEDFTPAWPEPIRTIEDGSTLRVLVLPAPEQRPALSTPAVGREQVVLDFVVENLTTEQGIEFTTSQQLRMIDASGRFVQPSAATKDVACRLDDGDVVPPGHARRFLAAYDMPAGEPRRLQYRGFEVDEVSVDLP